jgi:hypothetical protein
MSRGRRLIRFDETGRGSSGCPAKSRRHFPHPRPSPARERGARAAAPYSPSAPMAWGGFAVGVVVANFQRRVIRKGTMNEITFRTIEFAIELSMMKR